MSFDTRILATYATQLGLITSLAVENSKAGKAETEARDNRKGGLVDALRDLVTVQARDGIDVEAGATCLRIMLANVTGDDGKPLVPGGTVKNYVSAYKGYRKIMARGETIADVSTAKANEEMQSEELKRVKAAKKTFSELAKAWNADKWESFVNDLRGVTVSSGEESEEDATEEEAEAIHAAAA